jgi:hypothetical protein
MPHFVSSFSGNRVVDSGMTKKEQDYVIQAFINALRKN